jgi:uncharacterized caspase-like protein
VLVFIASHGFVGSGEVPEYYFLPSDVQTAAIEKLSAEAQGRQAPAGASVASLLSASELTAALRGVAGRRLLVIDTCHAGAAGVNTNPYSLAKRSAAAQFAVLSASTGSELSYEVADAGVPHGAFTYALIRGLEGAADKNGDGAVTLDEVFAYVTPAVKQNTELLNRQETRRNPRHRAFTQTPVLYAPEPLRASRL